MERVPGLERVPMMQWNVVNKLNCDIIEAANETGIEPHNVIIVGGIAIFQHVLETVGNSATTRFRGTHDIDLVVTENGAPQRIIQRLANQVGRGEIRHLEVQPSHFLDKDTWTVEVNGGGFLARKDRLIDVDIYSPKDSRGVVNFNGRTLGQWPRNFITEPVKLTAIRGNCQKSKAALPSLTDCLIMKLDVAATSGQFRAKDREDVLSLMAVLEKEGAKPGEVLKTATDYFYRFSSLTAYKRAVTALKSLFSSQRNSPIKTGFTPTSPYLGECVKAIK
jgi:hypothetical protein